LYFSELAELDEWPLQIKEPDPYFVLLLALDATGVPEAKIRAFADKMATQGVVYVCTWGPGCTQVHGIFDLALYVDNEELRRDADEHGSVIMTTWHEDEDLDEALYDAVFVSWPHDRYEEKCDAVLAVTVGSPAWASQVRTRLGDSDALQEDVLAREPET